MSDMVVIGKPYSLPYAESFPDSAASSIFYLYNSYASSATWILTRDSDFNIPSQDGDNGYLTMIGYDPDAECEIRTGKIALESTDNPELSFWYYGVIGECGNELDVKVYPTGVSEPSLLSTIVLNGTQGE